jgi:hypothetical protein
MSPGGLESAERNGRTGHRAVTEHYGSHMSYPALPSRSLKCALLRDPGLRAMQACAKVGSQSNRRLIAEFGPAIRRLCTERHYRK